MRKKREMPADRGKYKGTSFKRTTPRNSSYRKKATYNDIENELVKVSEYSDYPVTKDEAHRVMYHFSDVLKNLLIKKGEIHFRNFGAFYNVLVKETNKTPRRYHSSDDNFKKLGKTLEFIRTELHVFENTKALMNKRLSITQKIKKKSKISAEKRQKRYQACKEEDAAIALLQMYDGKKDIDKLMDKYWELIYWNDFSCYHTPKGKHMRDLPVRELEVKRRLLEIIEDKNGGERYLSTWDEYISVAGLEARGIEYDTSGWKPHGWKFDDFLSWKNK